jgi:hypothetical protein
MDAARGMEPAAPQPVEQTFLRTVGLALRRGGLGAAVIVASVLVVARLQRMVGRREAAEQLERELADPEALVRDFRRGWSPASQPTAADVGIELIDDVGLPEAPDRPAVGEDEPAPEGRGPSVTASAWLTSLREKEARELERSDERRERHVRREALLFRVLLVVAILAALFATVGAVLLLVGWVPAGVVSMVVAILPGSGSVLIRNMWKQEQERRDAAEAARSEYAAVVEATEWALSLDDEAERKRQANAIAERLQDRAFPK